MPNSNIKSVDAIAEHLVTVSLGVITMRNDGIYTQKQSEELLDKYQANATAALTRREERIKVEAQIEMLEYAYKVTDRRALIIKGAELEQHLRDLNEKI